MNYENKSSKSNHSAKLSVPSNDRLFDNARPPYRQHSDKNHKYFASKSNSSEIKARPTSREFFRGRDSLRGIIPVAERVRKYQQETVGTKNKFVHRSGYQENIPINERIRTIENIIAEQKKLTGTRKRNEEYTLRPASSERALELVQQYFKNPNPKSKRLK